MKRWEIYLEILCEIILLAGILFIIGFVLPKTLAFLWPLVAGWIIAVLAHPIQRFLQKKLKVSRRIGSAVIVIFVILLVSGLLYLAGSKLLQEGMEFAKSVPDSYYSMEDSVKQTWNKVKNVLPDSIGEKIGGTTLKISDEITSYITNKADSKNISRFAKSVTNGLIGVIVMFMSAYFFLADWDKMHDFVRNVEAPQFKKKIKIIQENIFGAIGGYFLAQLKLMGIIAILLFIGFLILGVDYILVLSILIALFDALPFVGVGTILIPWSAYQLMSGNDFKGIGLLILYVICLLTRHILQPKIVGQSVGLSAFSTLILMYVGMKVAGIIGFIIAVILGIIVKRLYELGMFNGSIQRLQKRVQMLKDSQ